MPRPVLQVIEGHRRDLEERAIYALFTDEAEFRRLIRVLERASNTELKLAWARQPPGVEDNADASEC